MSKILNISQEEKNRILEMHNSVKSLISEQEGGFKDNKLFWDNYAKKIVSRFKGKNWRFSVMINPETSKMQSFNGLDIQFTGNFDREHREDFTPLNAINNWGMVMEFIFNKTGNLPNAKPGGKGFVSVDLMFRNGKFIGLKKDFGQLDFFWNDFNDKGSANGWEVKDFGGPENLNLI